jgi:hypothetical protein
MAHLEKELNIPFRLTPDKLRGKTVKHHQLKQHIIGQLEVIEVEIQNAHENGHSVVQLELAPTIDIMHMNNIRAQINVYYYVCKTLREHGWGVSLTGINPKGKKSQKLLTITWVTKEQRDAELYRMKYLLRLDPAVKKAKVLRERLNIADEESGSEVSENDLSVDSGGSESDIDDSEDDSEASDEMNNANPYL